MRSLLKYSIIGAVSTVFVACTASELEDKVIMSSEITFNAQKTNFLVETKGSETVGMRTLHCDNDAYILTEKDENQILPERNEPTKGLIVTADLDNVGVWAKMQDNTNYFYNAIFRKDEQGVFKSSQAYYWISDNSYLDFYVYYPSSSDMHLFGYQLSSSEQEPAMHYSVPVTVSLHRDFCSGKVSASKGVPFVQLKHNLAAIIFKLGDIPNGTEIVSIKICGTSNEGSLSLKNNSAEWELISSYSDVYQMFTDKWVKVPGMKYGDNISQYFMMIPQTIVDTSEAYISITYKKTDLFAECKYPLSGTLWQAGHTYSYYLSILNQGTE